MVQINKTPGTRRQVSKLLGQRGTRMYLQGLVRRALFLLIVVNWTGRCQVGTFTISARVSREQQAASGSSLFAGSPIDDPIIQLVSSSLSSSHQATINKTPEIDEPKSLNAAGINSASSANLQLSQLARSAPYAIEGHQTDDTPQATGTGTGVEVSSSSLLVSNSLAASSTSDSNNNNNNNNARNIIFRLAINQTDINQDEEPWTFVTKNGTLIGSRANLNLKKLLEALEYNNYTSEVKFDSNNSSLINITISNMPDSLDKPDKVVDSLLLEELLMDANNNWKSLLNGSSIVKDNHRYEARQLVRVRPSALSGISGITSPPIRTSIEMAAENYTVRKISEEANIFAIKLLNQLNIEKLGSHNLIQSPFAVYQGLALLLMGAMGETAKELDRALLGSQSSFENSKLTHEQDRPRLLASFSDVIRQLQLSAVHHLRLPSLLNESSHLPGKQPSFSESSSQSRYSQATTQYAAGTPEQHLIVANNLLFSPNAYEISSEFMSTLETYFNNTALTKIEIGSTESIQVVNGWIRSATAGLIPSIMHKKSTFDEFNNMALLCTSWLAQEWKETFYRISSPLRSNIRLKGQSLRARRGSPFFADKEWTLLEFVDDNRNSHFVDFIKSKPSANIHHYHSLLNGMLVDVVSIPFKHSNHRFITLTPIQSPTTNTPLNITQLFPSSSSSGVEETGSLIGAQLANLSSPLTPSTSFDSPDSSQLSKLISMLTQNPRKALRNLWNIVAPEIITKQTLQTLQLARQKNVTLDETVIESSDPPLVQLSMPIIRSEADSSISAALNHIGLVNAFDPNQANFIGINGHPFNHYKLHLSNVLSKTTFNLNERGINYDRTIRTLEALRIFPQRTDEMNRQSSFADDSEDDEAQRSDLVDEVKLNKPFMYLICDIRTKLILYTGVVRNPEQVGTSNS